MNWCHPTYPHWRQQMIYKWHVDKVANHVRICASAITKSAQTQHIVHKDLYHLHCSAHQHIWPRVTNTVSESPCYIRCTSNMHLYDQQNLICTHQHYPCLMIWTKVDPFSCLQPTKLVCLCPKTPDGTSASCPWSGWSLWQEMQYGSTFCWPRRQNHWAATRACRWYHQMSHE